MYGEAFVPISNTIKAVNIEQKTSVPSVSATAPVDSRHSRLEDTTRLQATETSYYLFNPPESKDPHFQTQIGTGREPPDISSHNAHPYSKTLRIVPTIPSNAGQYSYDSSASAFPQNMAAAVLPAHHHFRTTDADLPMNFVDPLAGIHSSNDLLMTTPDRTSDHQLPYTSPPRWTTQQVLLRHVSKSPNGRDRTPIRHSRPDTSRRRSASRSEAILAYAKEQGQQSHPQPENVILRSYMPTSHPVPPAYYSQQFIFPPSSSPYLNQQSYYDPTGISAAYHHLPAQQQLSTMSTLYAMATPPAQSQQSNVATLNPVDTFYNSGGSPRLPAVTSIPSSFPPIPQPLESTHNDIETTGTRTKPQCWDHGCNGRQFSTFSNLLRHQREKSGTASKARCPHCGTEFTRTTARNGHMVGGKCKGLSETADDQEEPEITS